LGFAIGIEIRKSYGSPSSVLPKEEPIENKENCKPKSWTSADKKLTPIKKEKVLE
jgi:hypothetical protein